MNSNQNSRRNNRRQGARKPFCKVCHDAKQPGHDTHWVKDNPGKDGKVVCPYLLSLNCRYCHVKGHLPSQCPELKDRRMRQVRDGPIRNPTRPRVDEDGFMTVQAPRVSRRPRIDLSERKPQAPQPLPKSRWAALADDSDDDKPKPVEDFPQFGSSPARGPDTVRKLTGWAAVAAKPAAPKPVERSVPVPVQPKPTGAVLDGWGDDDEQEQSVPLPNFKPFNKDLRWADMSDDEDLFEDD